MGQGDGAGDRCRCRHSLAGHDTWEDRACLNCSCQAFVGEREGAPEKPRGPSLRKVLEGED